MRQLETRSTEEPLIKDGCILANSRTIGLYRKRRIVGYKDEVLIIN